MTQMVRICKYGCNMQMGEFDTKQNKYLEVDGKTLHTRERCESLKARTNPNTKLENHNGNNDISLEVLVKKLQSIGITLDLDKLRNARI